MKEFTQENSHSNVNIATHGLIRKEICKDMKEFTPEKSHSNVNIVSRVLMKKEN